MIDGKEKGRRSLPRRRTEQEDFDVVEQKSDVLDEVSGSSGDTLKSDVREEESRRSGKILGKNVRDRGRVLGELGHSFDQTGRDGDDEETMLERYRFVRDDIRACLHEGKTNSR